MTDFEQDRDNGRDLASRKMMTLQQLADHATISLSHLRRMIDAGNGPVLTKFGPKTIRVATADAVEFLGRFGLIMSKPTPEATKHSD
jgi:hypothetical protein